MKSIETRATTTELTETFFNGQCAFRMQRQRQQQPTVLASNDYYRCYYFPPTCRNNPNELESGGRVTKLKTSCKRLYGARILLSAKQIYRRVGNTYYVNDLFFPPVGASKEIKNVNCPRRPLHGCLGRTRVNPN